MDLSIFFWVYQVPYSLLIYTVVCVLEDVYPSAVLVMCLCQFVFYSVFSVKFQVNCCLMSVFYRTRFCVPILVLEVLSKLFQFYVYQV
jgi:hypothetical protein